MSEFKDWIGNVEVTDTLGNGWCVRIDGSDIFDDINQYDVKTRRTFSIASGLDSEHIAKKAATDWLSEQLEKLGGHSETDTLTEQVRQLREALYQVVGLSEVFITTEELQCIEVVSVLNPAKQLLEATK